MKNLLIGLLTASFLSACAVAPTLPHTPRDEIRNFAVDGRFALKITHADGQNETSGGRLSWTHENRMDRVLLANPLGIGLAEIEITPDKTRLRTGDGKTFEADDPERLIAEVTGQPLPISHLPAWLLGRPNGDGHIERDPQGRPLKLQEAGWHIEYAYEDDNPDTAPSRLSAFGEGMELRLRIETWKTTP
ncbi:lipoprotein insertase outer membrane protein LolB [Azonexus sp.]|uniref:lipoprotein insertase outer membrane protein LolB n=1 Tax=Azonexus sp. TaxID=1872668 RepID=UPI0027B90914|nr:lipoprotein insertase outer membrane protein LolB [Azonexus sp.]